MQAEANDAPLSPRQLKPARHFAAGFAGEHVAGTEFVIGALFVSWGVGTMDVIIGLAIGNLLAVLSWVLICAPIATETRMTLYAYLEKICGPGFMKVYSVVNGLLFCILAGAMITVSASAVRIPFGIPPQVEWYPTSPGFVLVALAVGAVVTFAAIKGFEMIARFAEVSAPWLVSMFFVGAIAVLPILMGAHGVSELDGWNGFVSLAEDQIWIDQSSAMGVWHVIAIAWGANLAFHGALGDMTILRFAKKTSYAWFSVLGMFVGHFGAWLAAGVMGAASAALLQTQITSLDAGEVAFQSLGIVGIWAVILAGWTTSNPTIYRAGLAFQSIVPSWSRERMTLIVGIATTIIACFPFVFTGLLNFLGLMALVMAPTGGIIVAEHYLLRRLGIPPYWREERGDTINLAAAGAWIASIGVAALCHFGLSMHVLFLFVPAWVVGLAFYIGLCRVLGAGETGWSSYHSYVDGAAARKASEDSYLYHRDAATAAKRPPLAVTLTGIACGTALVGSFVLAFQAFCSATTETYLAVLPAVTLLYFASIAAFLLWNRKVTVPNA